MPELAIEVKDIQSICWWKDNKILEMSAIIRSLEKKVKELEQQLKQEQSNGTS